MSMALVRYDPIRELDSFQSQMNRLFDSFFSVGEGNGRGQRWIPAMDLVESDDSIVLRADLPGMSEDDVEIEIKDGVLTVSGEREAEEEAKTEGFHRIERSYGSFSRSLALPRGTDAEKVDAKFDNGVLEVRIPKPQESKPTRVEI